MTRSPKPAWRAAATTRAACSGPRTSNVACTPVWRTLRSTPSRWCCTSTRLAPAPANVGEEPHQAAGAVVDAGEDHEPPPGRGLVASDQAGHDAEVDVAARQHHAGHAGVGGRARRPTAGPPRRPRRRPRRRAWPAPSAVTIASAMASSATVTTSSTHRSTSGRVMTPGRLTAMPSASVGTGPGAEVAAGVGGARRGLHADHPHVRA